MGNSKLVRILIAVISLGLSCSAQMLSSYKIKDPQARTIQQQYLEQLRGLSTEASSLHFPYPFYFSDVLDIDEARQKQLPVGSIRFETFHGETVLAISGNYYASYSASMMSANLRARKTFQDVILPVLKLAVAHMDRTVPFQ